MSLYNLVSGFNLASFLILPMLGKHPDSYPRFRDCFTQRRGFTLKDGLPIMSPEGQQQEEAPYIYLLTRVGGGNREDYKGAIARLRAMPEYVHDFDDDFDSTYATFLFNVPSRWLADFIAITQGNLKSVSAEYRDEIKRVFPKLADKVDGMFEIEPRKAKD